MSDPRPRYSYPVSWGGPELRPEHDVRPFAPEERAIIDGFGMLPAKLDDHFFGEVVEMYARALGVENADEIRRYRGLAGLQYTSSPSDVARSRSRVEWQFRIARFCAYQIRFFKVRSRPGVVAV